MIARLFAVLAFLALPAAARAELRDYCPDRPGIGTPPCTIDKGHLSFEVGLADWTLDRSPTDRTDTLILGDALLRYGLTDSTEIQLGWTSFGRERDHDRLTGARTSRSRVGDVSVAVRQNLRNPDGSGFSVALMPFATLPVGRQPIGAGDWGAGLLMPVAYELGEHFSLEWVPEIDAAVDGDGNGRHLAYGGVAGFQAKLSKAVTATAEYQLIRDDDPAGHQTQQRAGLALSWQPKDDLQFDLGANAGLRHQPDVELYIGIARRF
jgi:hypothetical protein